MHILCRWADLPNWLRLVLHIEASVQWLGGGSSVHSINTLPLSESWRGVPWPIRLEGRVKYTGGFRSLDTLENLGIRTQTYELGLKLKPDAFETSSRSRAAWRGYSSTTLAKKASVSLIRSMMAHFETCGLVHMSAIRHLVLCKFRCFDGSKPHVSLHCR